MPRAEVPPLRPGEPPPPCRAESSFTFYIPFSLPAPPSPPTRYHHRHCDPFCCLFGVPDLPKPRKSIPKLGQKSTRNPSRENIEIQTSKKLENHGNIYIVNIRIVGFPLVKLTVRKNSSNGNKSKNTVKTCSFISPKSNKNQ